MANESHPDEAAVYQAIRRQAEAPDDHDLGLIEESLRLTPDQRLQRLTRWVALVSSARRIPDSAQGGRA